METIGIGSRVKHAQFGSGVVINVKQGSLVITFLEDGIKEIASTTDTLEILEAVEPDEDIVSLFDVERSLTRIIKKFADYPETIPDLGKKWKGGKMVLHPGQADLSSKEVPIDSLFHKIVMIRDRMRTLEQRINSHSVLTDDDKVNLQQYITKIYGSLTTFNVLFQDKADHFSGEKK